MLVHWTLCWLSYKNAVHHQLYCCILVSDNDLDDDVEGSVIDETTHYAGSRH